MEEAVNNVYELPSTKEVIRYLHSYAVFPTKSTCLKAIQKRSYAAWPHLTLEAATKHFPESNEVAHGHMRGIKKGIRSTKEKKQPEKIVLDDGIELILPLRKNNDIFEPLVKELICIDLYWKPRQSAML